MTKGQKRRDRQRRRGLSGRPVGEGQPVSAWRRAEAARRGYRRQRTSGGGRGSTGTASAGSPKRRRAQGQEEGKVEACAEGTMWPGHPHAAPIPTQASGGCRKAKGRAADKKEDAQTWRRQLEARHWTRGRQQTSPPGRPSVPNLGAAPQCTSRPAAGETETPRRPPARQGALCRATAVAQAPTRPGRVRHARTTAGDEPSGERQQGRQPRRGGGAERRGNRRRQAANSVAEARKRRRGTVAGK